MFFAEIYIEWRKTLNIKEITRKAFKLCSMMVAILTLSSLALASTGKVIGDLSIEKINGTLPQVKINNELAPSGATVFSNNTITTPSNAGAEIFFGKFGRVQLAPNTVVRFSDSDKGLIGEISAGEITVFSESITVKASDGKTISPKFGDTVSSTGATQQTSPDDDDDNIPLVPVIVFAGIVGAAVVITLTGTRSQDCNFVSPTGTTCRQ